MKKYVTGGKKLSEFRRKLEKKLNKGSNKCCDSSGLAYLTEDLIKGNIENIKYLHISDVSKVDVMTEDEFLAEVDINQIQNIEVWI